MNISDSKKLKVCAGASAGGHMNQLVKLIKLLEKKGLKISFYITTMPELAIKLREKAPCFVIGETNRLHPVESLKILIRAFKIIIKEKPDLIITTGSLPLALACIISKIFKTKIIWIDSVANINKLSMSGNLMKHFADLFLTQWPDLVCKNKGIEYAGAIL